MAEEKISTDLLLEARSRYPIGTQYKCATGGSIVYTVREQSFEYIYFADQVYGEKGKGCLYNKGKWAPITNVATDPILEKLQSMFTPGVEFIPVYHDGKLYDTSYTVKDDWKIIKSRWGYSFVNKEETYMHPQFLYANGHWAQVTVANDKLLKLDEHIVFPLIDGKFVNYAVRHAHLGNTDTGNNSFILYYLGIKDYHAFCSKIYGYESSCGDFPSYQNRDMVAATKIVKEIMRLCEQKIIDHLIRDEPKLITVDPIAMWLPQTGAVSLEHQDEQELKLAEHHLNMTRTKNHQETAPVKYYRYLVWNASHYWYAHQTTKEVFTLKLNSINKQSNEKHTSSKSTKQSRAAILQSSNLKIGQGSTCRGVGLKGSISKVRLGNNGSNYQERLSDC